MYSNSQSRERKRIRDDFGSFGPPNSGARNDFLFRERIDTLSQKRSRGSWGERGEWENEHGQILDRQLPDRQNLERERESRDLGPRDIGPRDIGTRDIGQRDIGWDRGLTARGRVSGRDDSYFGTSSSGVGRERGGDDNEHRWSTSGGRDGPSGFPSESGIYRSHSASEYENDRSSNANDMWHGGYRDGFDRDRIRRERDERDERDKLGPGSAGHNRRPSPLYFEQPRGSSREREKSRERPREISDVNRGRYQRSLSPHYAEPSSLRRSGLPSVDGYSQAHSKSYWNRPSGLDSASSSSNKGRSHSPIPYHVEDRELMRSEGIGRSSRTDTGRHNFGSNDEFRGPFDNHRRTGPPRDDNGGPNSGFTNGFGGFSHPSRDRYPFFSDQDSDRGEGRGNRGFWGPPQGLNRGGFFAGRGGMNRFGCNLEGIGRSTHTALGGVRNLQIQRRSDDLKKQPSEEKAPTSSSTDENVPEGLPSTRSTSGDRVDTAREDVVEQGEGSDNMEIDTDTQEVMATPVRRLRTITDPDVKQFLILREALMDYALAKSLCTIGVKPASFRSIIPQDPTLSAQSSKNSTEFAGRDGGRSNTPMYSSTASSSSRLLGLDQGTKGSRGAESSSGKEQQTARTGSVDANGVSRQQGRVLDRNGAASSSGASRAAPLPPYPKTGSRSQPQPPPSNPPYNQQQYGHGHGQGQGQGQGQDYSYLSPNHHQQRSYQNNQSSSYNDCYNYNRGNNNGNGNGSGSGNNNGNGNGSVSQRASSDNLNLQGQSHHIEEGRPRPPQGPPKGPGRGPQPPLPPVPAPPTR